MCVCERDFFIINFETTPVLRDVTRFDLRKIGRNPRRENSRNLHLIRRNFASSLWQERDARRDDVRSARGKETMYANAMRIKSETQKARRPPFSLLPGYFWHITDIHYDPRYSAQANAATGKYPLPFVPISFLSFPLSNRYIPFFLSFSLRIPTFEFFPLPLLLCFRPFFLLGRKKFVQLSFRRLESGVALPRNTTVS